MRSGSCPSDRLDGRRRKPKAGSGFSDVAKNRAEIATWLTVSKMHVGRRLAKIGGMWLLFHSGAMAGVPYCVHGSRKRDTRARRWKLWLHSFMASIGFRASNRPALPRGNRDQESKSEARRGGNGHRSRPCRRHISWSASATCQILQCWTNRRVRHDLVTAEWSRDRGRERDKHEYRA